jgi:hypothetical protein
MQQYLWEDYQKHFGDLGMLAANKQHWFLAWLSLKSAKLLASDSAKRA